MKKSKKDTKVVKSSAVKVKKAPAKGLKKPKSIKSPAKKLAVKKAKKWGVLFCSEIKKGVGLVM